MMPFKRRIVLKVIETRVLIEAIKMILPVTTRPTNLLKYSTCKG